MTSRLLSIIMGALCVVASWAMILGSKTDFTPLILSGVGCILLDVNKKEKTDG